MAAPDQARTVIDAGKVRQMAIQDLMDGLFKPQLWWHFAMHDTKQRFRRSTLGPLWITMTMAVMVTALGFVFGQIFSQDITTFIPYLAVGLILWGLLTSAINEGSTSFVSYEGYVKNVPMPLSVHYYRVFARNVIFFLFNSIIYIFVFIILQRQLMWQMLLFVPGIILFTVNVFLMGLIAAVVSTRFRDIPQIIANVLQVVFFVTPIFWSIEALPNRPAFVFANPFFHLLEIVRQPLLGQAPHALSWIVALGLIAVLVPVALWLYRRAYARLPYWV